MSAADVHAEFHRVWADPAAKGWGDVYHEVGERVVRELLPTHRGDIVEVFREWMRGEDAPGMLFAVIVAEKYELAELADDTEDLDRRIRSGAAFLPHYSYWTTKAMQALRRVTP